MGKIIKRIGDMSMLATTVSLMGLENTAQSSISSLIVQQITKKSTTR